MKNEVASGEEVTYSVKRVINRIKLLTQLNGSSLIQKDQGLIFHTKLQVLYNFKYDLELDNAIHRLILTHALKAEACSPGGFDLTATMLLEGFSRLQCGILVPTSRVTSRDNLWVRSDSASSTDVDTIIDTYSTPRSSMILKQALKLAGFGGRVIVEKSQSLTTSVELIRGFTFNECPAFPINVSLNTPRVLCIDGFIETVAEFNCVLSAASELKDACVVFVRGMSEDVKQTLRVNYDRGTLRVIPIIVKFDLEGINTLNDVAIVAGADLVSSNKGDLITNIDLKQCPFVDNITVTNNKVIIKNNTTSTQVRNHIKYLRDKRSVQSVEDVCRLLDTRIRSLTPNHVIIRLNDGSDYVLLAQEIDYVLRAIKSLVDHGMICVNGKRMLAATFFAADLCASKCLDALMTLGSVVIRPAISTHQDLLARQ